MVLTRKQSAVLLKIAVITQGTRHPEGSYTLTLKDEDEFGVVTFFSSIYCKLIVVVLKIK